MKKALGIALIGLLLTVAALVPVRAQEQPGAAGRDAAFEQEIYDRLGQIDPGAVPLFQGATQAMDAGDMLAARQYYEQVLSLAPGFPDALRRLSYVELELGNVETAVEYARQAYDSDPSPYNQSALASALLDTGTPAGLTEAFRLSQQAAQALPDDLSTQATYMFAAIEQQDTDAIREASAAFIRLDPANPVGHYIAGLVAAEDGQFEKAEQELLLAQELGMSAEAVQEVLDSGIRSQLRFRRILQWAGYSLAAWLIGLVCLTILGVLLSRLTLLAVRRTEVSGQFQVGRGEGLLRSIYRLVIGLTSLYFYISIPFTILIVLALTLGILYLFLLAGRVPLRLAAFVGLAGLYTLYAIVRSLFARVKDTEPGRPLPEQEAPDLWVLARDVAGRLGTQPIDEIYVTPGVEIAVTERGGLWKRLRGLGRRSLILGLGTLPGMTQGQLQAILAHEYGHFSNRDTAGGNLARQVQISMLHMAHGLAVNGQARWYNPAWIFLQLFHRIFLLVTLGASRLQEILADRYAAMAYGIENFVSGLKHIISQSLVFEYKVTTEVRSALQQDRALHNLYALPPPPKEQRTTLEAQREEVMGRPTSSYDSHPAPGERIALVEKLEVHAGIPENKKPVWRLLPDRKALQAEMTEAVQANVNQMAR